MSNKPRKLALIFGSMAGCCLLICGLIVGLALLLTLWAVNNTPKPAPTYILHSTRPYSEVVVPFEEGQDGIIVKAFLAGTPVDCIVDTGCRDIMWEGLNVNCVWDNHWRMYPYMDGSQVPFIWGRLPSLRIGDYEVPNVWSAYLRVPGASLTSTSQGRPIHATLGNYAFRNVVLTIDFQQHQLIIRSPEYDISRLLHRKEDCLTDFTPLFPVEGCPEYILVDGNVADAAATFMVDTGHYGKGIIITPEVRNHLKTIPMGSPPNFWYILMGKPITEVTKPLAWSIGNVNGVAPAFVMDIHHGWQANIGYNDLKNFRVTIDYPRHKMLLEPYH